MKDSKVTVLMSVYNGEKYLREAIDSILNQTFRDFEFLIINDGSTDRTIEILRSYHDRRIKIINNERNMGLTKSLNKGLKMARGEYIARMDADDISLPNRLDKQLAVMEKNNNIGVVACWLKIIDDNNNEIRPWHADRESNSPEEIYYTLFFENCIAHSSVLFNKKIVLKIGGYDESFKKSQDYELWTRLSKITKITKIKDALVVRRKHSGNISFETKNQHKAKEEQLFLRSINTILPNNKFNSNKLLSLKYDEANCLDILESLSILSNINKSIIETAPPFLRRDILKECGYKKRNKILRNFARFFFDFKRSPTKILKFIMRYSLDYIYFFFSFKRECLRLKMGKDKKNILCIVPHMVMGGAERVVLNIAQGTDREKFNFHIVTTKPENNAWYNEFHPYFQNIITPGKRVSNENIYNKYFRELIKRLDIDMVLISNSWVGYKYLPQLKSEFKHVRTMDILHAEASPGASDGLEWEIPCLDRRVCISNHLKEYMSQRYRNSGIEDRYIKRLMIIHNGVDLRRYSPHDLIKGRFKSRFGISDDVRIISFIGRFSWEKNPLLFVDTAKSIIEKSPDDKLKFIMAGDGPDFDEIKAGINEYRIDDYFILTGMISDIEVIEFLADTYALLVTSKNEGIPFSILEAMAMKVPVISINVGAVHEIIKDDINGYLINPENNVVEQFTCKILDLLSKKLNYSEVVKRARETIVSEYSLKTMGVKYHGVFNELLGEN